MNEIKVLSAIPDDVYGIRKVQKITWLDTYPNVDLGITRDDIESRFADDDTEAGKVKMEERKKRLLDPNFETLVAKDNDEIVGFCTIRKEKGHHRVQALYVLPTSQGRGIGKRLMEHGLKILGVDEDIYIDVATYNHKAISFYESFGFTKTDRTVENPVAALPSGANIPEIELLKKA